MSRPASVLLWLVYSGVCPSQVIFQTYLNLGGGSVTGTCMVPRGGVVFWATVECTDMLMQARALSIARVCDLYNI